MKIQETLLVVLSDMHTGSSTALFPQKGFIATAADGNLISPNQRQREIFSIWVRFAGEVKVARKNKRLILINLGDAIDGFHHNSMQESLYSSIDQSAAHVELMQDFIQRIGFRGGDELYYVRGTEVHVGDTENGIAQELGAIETGEMEMKKKLYISDILKLNINGTNHVFAHHGKERGAGQNEGNALRNFLRDVRSDRTKDGLERIDALWSGHTHGHTWNTHIARIGGEFHEFHGIICPSWQAKTRYALAKVPMAVNSIGGTYTTITADGQIYNPHFVVGITKDR